MAKREIKAALLGLGTVGSGVYKLVHMQEPEMESKLGSTLQIKKVLVRNLEKAASKVEDPSVLTNSWQEILDDPEIELVIEVMGGIEPAGTYIRQALSSGRHVVTANKDLIAEQGLELTRLAQENEVDLLFEAAVAGGIPIIDPLKNSLSANHITEIMGIVNGTTNFILTKMTEEGMDFGPALEMAQQLGYAEADPTADVEGLDAGRKVAIMATLAFHTPVTFRDVYTEGISSISSKDIASASEIGRKIKLIGVAKETSGGVEVRVHPMMIPAEHPLANVSGSFNAVFVHGDAVDDVMFYGRGAGEMPTASAIMGDVFAAAKTLTRGMKGSTMDPCYRNLPIKKPEDMVSRYYLRMSVDDKPGVLATLASVLGNNGVSIQQLVQKVRKEDSAEIMLVTDLVKEYHLKDALLTFRAMSIVRSEPVVIRVL
ncbi:MAG: homoserine dehydrogenase [Lachnospiraceae bacterium]|nr:homoserine dehydrogenase [Lachnospiraceae bacterium]